MRQISFWLFMPPFYHILSGYFRVPVLVAQAIVLAELQQDAPPSLWDSQLRDAIVKLLTTAFGDTYRSPILFN
jgi:hypothetical protein